MRNSFNWMGLLNSTENSLLPRMKFQDNDSRQSITNGPTNDSTDIMALLAAALNMTGDNEIAKDLIADVLNAIKES